MVQIGNIKAEPQDFNTIKENIEKNPVRCADLKAAEEMEELILAKKQEGDSVGGIVETIAVGAPAGLGEPVFERLDGDLADDVRAFFAHFLDVTVFHVQDGIGIPDR